MPRRLLVTVVALLIALVGAESVLRLLGLPSTSGPFGFLEVEVGASHIFAADDELFWKLRADTTYVNSNRLGLRGWLPEGDKGPHELRIACVGDSCTYGLAVRYEEAWGIRLERLLQRQLPAARVTSILAGLPGYSTHQDRLLYDRSIAALQPDVTVLYCGAWNDYVAAILLDDAARSARQDSWLHSLRIVQLTSQATVGDLKAHAEQFARDEAPDGRRVSLADYRANLEAMIARATGIGSMVVVVVAPFTERNARVHPIALQYRAATREVAERHALPIVDAPALFAERHAAVPADWHDEVGEWPCLGDAVHPTVTGHEVIAAALAELLHERHPALRPGSGAGPTSPRIETLAPARLTAIAGDRLRVTGTGFVAGGFDRVWLGDWWIPDWRIVDDRTLELTLPLTLPAGVYPVELSTPHGPVRSAARVQVDAPTFVATAERTSSVLVFEASGEAQPGWRIGLWYGVELRSEPAATEYGAFAIAAEPDGRPPGFETGPFRLDRLPLLHNEVRCDADGRWHVRIERPLTAHYVTPEAVCVQGLIVDTERPGHAVFTQPVRAAVTVTTQRR